MNSMKEMGLFGLQIPEEYGMYQAGMEDCFYSASVTPSFFYALFISDSLS